MSTVPIVMTSAGRTSTPPATLLAQIIALAEALNPGVTADLPATLIEDVASTSTGAAVVMDQALTESIASVTPYGANAFSLSQQGALVGIPVGQPVNTSVYVVFSGSVRYAINAGFTVSDGSYQYVVQTGGVVASSGSTPPLYCVANQSGTWSVPAGTVDQIITSVPSPYTITCTNPQTGIPATAAESEGSYRARVMKAYTLASATGFLDYLKSQLIQVPGVVSRLVSVRQANGGYEVIVGGGDPSAVAYAIFLGLFDLNTLVPSVTSITGITNASPGVVTTAINHGLTTGQTGVDIAGVVGMTGVNGGPYTVTVLSPTTFSFGVNTTSAGSYTSGGAVTPNTRNTTVSIIDYPDTYSVTFVNPPQQTLALEVTWNTNAPNAIAPAAVAQLAQQPLVDYVNSIPVGQPLNGLVAQSTFQTAVASVIPAAYLDRLVLTVSINGVGVSPSSGTQLYYGDPESYFETSTSLVTIAQG